MIKQDKIRNKIRDIVNKGQMTFEFLQTQTLEEIREIASYFCLKQVTRVKIFESTLSFDKYDTLFNVEDILLFTDELKEHNSISSKEDKLDIVELEENGSHNYFCAYKNVFIDRDVLETNILAEADVAYKKYWNNQKRKEALRKATKSIDKTVMIEGTEYKLVPVEKP